ncbi:helix-turn-helix domain-containing protein [Candidatus Pantoea carbekii]|uniref:Uncharacterized protein n=1 Tax=Candidatus Pantoea carbekii TaxID=1235990 RepID=U3U6G5_9GAMM|nr:helix-turn-helix domain-containing protein [Candidatus Pantoea carbekii]AKC32027.1 putative transcriptional regulator [Candidatus Pantoea carbekii]BAO00550.1 hypothetical protein HHS_05800 [Candidatus Pantoea carbekii]
MKKTSAGGRIRARRKSLKFTQQALAERIGVSHVAVSQWEKEETVPRGENLLRLAELLQCTAAWIIDGDGEIFIATNKMENTKIVPLFSLAQISNFSEQKMLLQQASRFLYSDEQISDMALAIILDDNAMQPEYQAGEVMIFDPLIQPQPSDVVLALANGQPVVRIFRLQIQHYDEQIFSLRPLNDDFPILQSSKNKLKLIGTLLESRRYRSSR